jgi:transcriptional regulator with XRE-family HTH domain
MNFDAAREFGRIMIGRFHIKAARELLGWSQEACARRSGIGLDTFKRLEVGSGVPTSGVLAAVSSTLERAGIRAGDNGKIVLVPPTGGSFPSSQLR